MKTRAVVTACLAPALLAGVTLAEPAGARPVNPPGHNFFGRVQKAVCAPSMFLVAHCQAHVLQSADGTHPDVTSGPNGLSPATVKSAYGYSTSMTAGAGQTVAIVDAYNDPTAEADLGVFSTQFGLPDCTTANGCFSKVNQTGGTSYPATNSGWALEISLDVQWAHAIAPGAKILLVEATSASFNDLLAAEDYAAAHANYVSNSWGAGEFSGEQTYDSHFTRSGVSYFVAAGDNGLPAEYPSSSPNVISVGGTLLTFDGSGNLASETAWSGGGGGCSVYETAPSAQSSFSQYGQVSCGGKRATPDVSLVADPASGVSVYDTTASGGQTGWFIVGGTSAATPMWAARAAVSQAAVSSSTVYGSTIPFRDITSGNNGAPALVGFDLASGRGSWADASSPPPPPPNPPNPPTNLTASTGSSAINLSWTAATGSPTSYQVYRGTSSGTETLLASGLTGTSYSDNQVSAGATYFYEVTAVNSAGESGLSNEASASAPLVPPRASFTKSCSNATCTFTSTSSGGSGTITVYKWSGGNGLTGSTATVKKTYTANGTFTVTLKITNSLGATSTVSGSVKCSGLLTRRCS